MIIEGQGSAAFFARRFPFCTSDWRRVRQQLPQLDVLVTQLVPACPRQCSWSPKERPPSARGGSGDRSDWSREVRMVREAELMGEQGEIALAFGYAI